MHTPLTLLALCFAISAAMASVQADMPDGASAAQSSGYRMLSPVALREPVKDALPEQWEDRPTEGKGVRNVVNPTLTPVLPADDRSNGLAVIVAPGRGFINLAFDNEGTRVAQFLAQNGIAAFVLKYRLRPTPRDEAEYRAAMMRMMSGGRASDAGSQAPREISTPAEAVEDAEAAVRLARARASDWGVDPAKVGFIGFSAGAMTTLGVAFAEDAASRPDFIAPIYGPRDPGPVPDDAPPMFLAIALDDPLFKLENTLALIEGWKKAGRPFEVHLYGKGGHGFGMRPRSEATGLWTGQFLAWMKDRGWFLDAAKRKRYVLASMKIGEILDDPAKRAVLARHVPGFADGPGIEMARMLSIGEISRSAPQALPPDKLEAILADLAKLP